MMFIDLMKRLTDDQLFHCTTELHLEVQTLHGNEFHLFLGQGISSTLTSLVAHLIEARTSLGRDSNPSPTRQPIYR